MKRSGPPERRTRLRPGRPRSRVRVKRDGPTEMELACIEVDRRSRGLCEANVPGVCPSGQHPGQHHHHRILRAQGGPDTAENLLAICPAGHDWAHNVDRAEAERLGIILRSHGNLT